MTDPAVGPGGAAAGSSAGSQPGAVALGGLSSVQAGVLAQRFGANVVPAAGGGLARSALGKFWSPVPWLLEAAVVLELALGQWVQAGIIGGLLAFNAALGLWQEGRAQATLAALQCRLALTATVLRDGLWVSLPAAALVPGDVVALALGAVVPADVRLLSGGVLLDESMLTGESVPVEASPGTESYAGALVRRGEAVAEVTATGARTRFARTAELVQSARSVSTQQAAVVRVVRNLALLNGVILIALIGYGFSLGLGRDALVSLVLTAVLAAIPVALPATFSLAAAIGAHTLAQAGTLVTRLSAVDEAAALDVLCCDKTGTLTQNSLTVKAVRPLPGHDQAQVLALAALASSDAGTDPIDTAIRRAAAQTAAAQTTTTAHAAAAPTDESGPLTRTGFVPFDPATKMAQATASGPDGVQVRVVKGAVRAVLTVAGPPSALDAGRELEAQGYRVLAVATGPTNPAESAGSTAPAGSPASVGASGGALRIVGLVALSDPPRADSAQMIADLDDLGVQTIMVTGDARTTAATLAGEVGLTGPVYPPARPLSGKVHAHDYAVYAGVLPEDKHRLVAALQARGHVVGMCGDGVNDAPALRQAQMGIAVSDATDVAKSAAGIVLTTPGLEGILAAVRAGRIGFQRILSYTLNSITKKTVQALFLLVGLVMTGHAILTPYLMVLIMITGDFLGMALTTDTARPSPQPNAWHINRITTGGVAVGLAELVYCLGLLAVGHYSTHLSTSGLQTLAFVLIVFGNQATCYTNRDRHHWYSSRPSRWLLASTALDLAVCTTLALTGAGMTPLSLWLIAAALGGALVLLITADSLKVRLFARLHLA